MEDNTFTWIEDTRRAQRFADRPVTMNWPRIHTSLARRVNPLLKDLLAGMNYYWISDQAEYATDVVCVADHRPERKAGMHDVQGKWNGRSGRRAAGHGFRVVRRGR